MAYIWINQFQEVEKSAQLADTKQLTSSLDTIHYTSGGFYSNGSYTSSITMAITAIDLEKAKSGQWLWAMPMGMGTHLYSPALTPIHQSG